MTTLGWLAFGLAALALHEYLVSSSRLRGLRATTVRYVLLLVALIAAGLGGPAIVAQLEELVAADSSRPVPFSAGGDVALTNALARQQPEWPFPTGQPQAAVEMGRSHVLSALRARVGVGRLRACAGRSYSSRVI